MEIIIDGYDFWNFKPERYWSLPKSKNPKVEIPNLIFGLEYMAARKIDGQWAAIIKDMEGNFHMRARNESVNGGYINKIEWVPHITKELEDIPNGTVLIGEVYIPTHEGSKNMTRILGCLKDKSLKRQEDEDWKVHFYIFDCLAYNGKNIMSEPLERRINHYIDYEMIDILADLNYIEIAEYYIGQALWDQMGKIFVTGGEGIVLQKRSAPYTPGKRTAWKTCKVKKEISTELDLFFTGRYKPSTKKYQGRFIKDWIYWMHKRTGEKMQGYYYDDFKEGATIEPISKGYYFGWAGSIELAAMDSEGKIVPVAWISNISEDVREKVTTGEMDKQVVKVQAMEIDSESHALRHAKIVEYRNDKDWRECGIEQLY